MKTNENREFQAIGKKLGLNALVLFTAMFTWATCLECSGQLPEVIQGPIQFRQSNYYLLEASSWTNADAKSRELGGYLVAINDEVENQWLIDNFNPFGEQSYLIGLTDSANEGIFEWVSGDQLSFENWDAGEPNDFLFGEDFAMMRRNGLWNDIENAPGNQGQLQGIIEVACIESPELFAATDWTEFDSNSANGILDGIAVTASRTAGGAFTGISTSSFCNTGSWDTSLQLDCSAEGISMQPINSGAVHEFTFGSSLPSVLLYIENFDSFSDAMISSPGANNISLVASTDNIFYESSGGTTGRIFTTFGGFSGFADAVLKFDGNIESVELQYTNGIQNNGIVYTLVTPVKKLIEVSSTDKSEASIVKGEIETQLNLVNNGTFGSPYVPIFRHADFHVASSFRCDAIGAFEPPAVGAIDDTRLLNLLDGSVNNLTNDTLTNPNSIYIFVEQSSVQTNQPINVDWQAGIDDFDVTYGGTTQPTGGSIPAGTLVTSHLLHFDTLDNESATNAGAASFESAILGVILGTEFLNATDSILGVAGVDYPNASGRAWEIGGDSASINISSDGRTIFVVGLVDELLDQMRIITAASPEDFLDQPYVSADEFIDGADEVTFDNCSSAWYRFTFELPDNFTNVHLSGIANVDDVAVAWLNGNRISAEVSIDDLGVDRVDEDGLPLLSWPTRDPFGSCDPSNFVSGTNELLFGVIGDLSEFDPTGLEFEATVAFDEFLLGDVNQDGNIDLLDIQPFVDLLTSGGFLPEADINADGEVDLLDIGQFVDLLTGA